MDETVFDRHPATVSVGCRKAPKNGSIRMIRRSLQGALGPRGYGGLRGPEACFATYTTQGSFTDGFWSGSSPRLFYHPEYRDCAGASDQHILKSTCCRKKALTCALDLCHASFASRRFILCGFYLAFDHYHLRIKDLRGAYRAVGEIGKVIGPFSE